MISGKGAYVNNFHYTENFSKNRKIFHYTENSVPRRKASAASWRLQSRSSYFIRIQKLKREAAFRVKGYDNISPNRAWARYGNALVE